MHTHERKRIWFASLGIAVMLLSSSVSLPALADNEPISAERIGDVKAAASLEAYNYEPIPLDRTGSARRAYSDAPSTECTEADASGVVACIEVRQSPAFNDGGVGTRTIQPVPAWCADHFGEGVYVTRTQACESFDVQVTKNVLQNGVPVQLGRAGFSSYSYLYTSFSEPTFVHQFGMGLVEVIGDVSGVFFNASSQCAGGCSHLQGVIPAIPVTTTGWQNAESFSEPASLPSGAIAYLATRWRIGVTVSGGTVAAPPAYTGYLDARCDNAISNRGPGCAIDYAPGLVVFSSSTTPALTAHLAQAVGSGLPGGSATSPLHRTTDENRRQLNRSLACGSFPGAGGLSCDEYPFASTYEGAASGGPARTFPGCGLADPPGSGPVGFSRCAIPLSQNSSQGGTLSGAYRSQRLLDGDPFYIGLT